MDAAAGVRERRNGGCCRRRLPCRAATTVAAAVATVLLHMGATPTVVTATAAAMGARTIAAIRAAPAGGGRAVNASTDAATVAWVASLHEAAASATPPLPSTDLFRRHDGLWTLYAGTGFAAGQALLEVAADQLGAPFTLATEYSSLLAGTQGLARRADTTAVAQDRVYAFRLAAGVAPPTVELYQPPLGQQSVDPTHPASRKALSGISTATVQSFPARRTADGRLLFDARPWVAAAFHLPDYAGFSVRFVGGGAHPAQVTFALDVVSADGGSGGAVKVSAVALPRRRMKPVPLDDRIGYFARPFTWVDDYAGVKAAPWGAHILKWDLAKHPVFTYYVDPTVPRVWWPAVVEGVTRWNPAFAAAGHRRPVLRAVVPTDVDWPADYAADDARFNTVSFVAWDEPSAVAGMKTDPRTGEILNVDIIFGSAMLRSFASSYRLWFGSDRDGEVASGTGVTGGGVAASADPPPASPPGRPVPGSEADFVYQQVADTTAHEVGHTLGLRHNFRGSAGIPWSQLTNITFTETNGLTTSVMDYLPLEPLPRSDGGSPPRYFATPVVGAYDVAAIRYGYTDWRSSADARAHAEAVADAGLAFATDADQAADALAQQFDHSASPLEWHRHNVRQVRVRVGQLVATAGSSPTVSAADLAADVNALLTTGVGSVLGGAKLVGATVTHRRRTADVPAVTPVDAATEAAAAAWVLSQLHPEDGLLSAATVAAVAPHLLTAPTGDDCFGGAACLGRSPSTVATALHGLREQVLAALLSPSRLGRLAANAAATAAAGGDAARRLSVGSLLGGVSDTVFGADWAHLPPATTATDAGLFRAETQARWVATLKELTGGDSPAAAGLAAAAEMSRVAGAVAAAAAAEPADTHLQGLQLATAAFQIA